MSNTSFEEEFEYSDEKEKTYSENEKRLDNISKTLINKSQEDIDSQQYKFYRLVHRFRKHRFN
jgi:hypothetical protein